MNDSILRAATVNASGLLNFRSFNLHCWMQLLVTLARVAKWKIAVSEHDRMKWFV